MAETITKGATTITPLLVLGYSATRESNNILHRILGSAEPDVSLAPDSPRAGTLRLLFETEADAVEAEQLHALPGPLVLASADRPGIAMTYVRQGTMTIELDAETLDLWVLEVGFQAVAS